MAGPLSGVRIVEMAGVGPAPFAGMMLADHGAEVIRIDRPGGVQAGVPVDPSKDILNRSRTSFAVDLKHPEGVALIRALCRSAEGLIEGFRPQVMERLGLGPEVLLADHPSLVYGRMTGWGQTGPYARRAGHDINYIALAGNLHGYGREGGKPTPPANAVGDFGGGGMLLAFAMVSAILHARQSGQGQVIDCAMTEGAALIASMSWALRAAGAWRDERGVNLLDGGAPFYDTYETADGRYISLGPIEPQFYERFCLLAGLSEHRAFAEQMNTSQWPEQKRALTALFKGRSRDEWTALLEGQDVCYAPVLSMAEAPAHPHNASRGTFIEVDGVTQPAPAPRYSVTVAATPAMPNGGGADAASLLKSLGYGAGRISAMQEDRVIVL